MAEEEEADKVTVKLIYSKRTKCIMYAEAGKDFIDMILGILEMPTGALARLSLNSPMPARARFSSACIENVYRSVQKMPRELFKADKSLLLQPRTVSSQYRSSLLGIQSQSDSEPDEIRTLDASSSSSSSTFYVCRNSENDDITHSLSRRSGAVQCPCGFPVDRAVRLVDQKIEGDPSGYVKKNPSFIITDDLRIMPLSSTLGLLQLWNDLRIKEPSELEERSATVGFSEVCLSVYFLRAKNSIIFLLVAAKFAGFGR
eukprot:TRINITY_DN1807_c0_g1_i1.p1 TRINITY_DN1807_c0_g1~~TRINITY_DN1807_c0_g1_i1.p1  ORF type:complete len:258 (-),score=20.72 TRINITY_DN1807_c0_g1_i1:572-1345(-)